MTDKEYIKISGSLKTLIELAKTFRVVLSKKEVKIVDAISKGLIDSDLDYYQMRVKENPEDTILVGSDEAKAHPKYKERYLLLGRAERECKSLIGILDGVDDFASYHLASDLFKLMAAFVSATSDQAVFRPALVRCRKIMGVLKPSKKAQERADAKKKAIDDYKTYVLQSPAFIKAKKDGDIDEQMNWNGKRLDSLVLWLVCHVTVPMIGDDYSWKEVDGIFVFKGKPVTARMLSNCAYRMGLKDTIERPVSPSIN